LKQSGRFPCLTLTYLHRPRRPEPLRDKPRQSILFLRQQFQPSDLIECRKGLAMRCNFQKSSTTVSAVAFMLQPNYHVTVVEPLSLVQSPLLSLKGRLDTHVAVHILTGV
jgi:hypothetical protein